MKKRIMAALKTNDAKFNTIVFLCLATSAIIAVNSGVYRLIAAVILWSIIVFVANLAFPTE